VSFVAAFTQEPLPRFRGTANLVNVDASFSKDGKPVTDLKPDDIEIYEDDQLQKVENFRLVRPAADRVFAVFVDSSHVAVDGSTKGRAALSEFLNRIIGPDDLVGVMTPDMPSRSLSLTRREAGLNLLLGAVTTSGQRDTANAADRREKEVEACYPDNDPRHPRFRGVAKEIIERRREQKALQALGDLVTHLGNLRDERKFVVLLSEGWVLFRQNQILGATDFEPNAVPGFDSCERERSMLAFVDHSIDVRLLAQRANRANVTFLVVDPRALSAPDNSTGQRPPANPVQDRERMAARQGGLRELAGNTDGAVVLNANDVKSGQARITSGLGAYYLMQYYSTSPKLDGKYRHVTIKVKRPGIQVRARDGYLAPTEAEARSAGVAVKATALPDGVVPLIRQTQMTALRRGPSTGLSYVRAIKPEFRRTERLRVEMAMPAGAANASGQILNSRDQVLALPVSYTTSERDGKIIGTADVTLAPLAESDYKLSLSFEVGGEHQTLVYAFRIVP
jgi:VWFA-related protein